MTDVPRPKLQRTYSDPDLPQLLPLPVRPSSSRTPRPPVKARAEFSPEIIKAMAQKLCVELQTLEPGDLVEIVGLPDYLKMEGSCLRQSPDSDAWWVKLKTGECKEFPTSNLNPKEHSDFIWVVRDCLLALREDGWRCVVHGEDLTYVHASSPDPRSHHELVELHRKLAERLMQVNHELKMKRLDPHYLIQQLVYLAIMGEKDVRGVTNPKLLHEILDHLEISSQDEPYLIPRLKVTIEDSYFRMKKFGAHHITVESCIDVKSLIINLDLDRVGFLQKISPSGLVYCVECSTALGDVISAGCHDVLCNGCAVETHSTGNRQDHPLVFFEQSVCSECERKSALVRCQDCVELFCYDCFKSTHARGKRQKHNVSLPQRTFCFECDQREASYICVECLDALCSRCSSRIHRSGARQNHTLFGLRKAAYNKKLFGNNLDRLMGIIQKNITHSYSLSPWFVFYDAGLAPYWYDFQKRMQVRADPNDLVNPPLGQVTDEDLATMSADEQFLRGLPGCTELHKTHAAQFAQSSAVFDVPPPMHIKFASPAHG